MKKFLLLTAFSALFVILAACSGGEEQAESDNTADSSSEVVAENNTLDIEGTNFEFGSEKFVVKSGEEVTINFKSTEGIHGLAIDDFDVNISNEGTATFTPTEPGEYKIYCSIPCGEGHDNMVSTLVVE